MKNTRNKIAILIILTVIFTFVGGTFSWLTWRSSTNTTVAFTVTPNFSCSVDGGGNITDSEVTIMPTNCTNSEHTIVREVTTSAAISGGMSVYMDLWLDIKDIGEGLTNSKNFRYALTKSSTSCTTDVVAAGSFNGKTNDDKINLLGSSTFNASSTNKYYLYIWLDSAETSTDTMNQTFELSLGGSCTNIDGGMSIPSVPTLDEGMIPVTISDSGAVTTISDSDSDWYDYSEQQWANAVLVSDETRSNYQGTSGISVASTDILGYYVWIPRYRYSMSKLLCSDISNVNETDYPECYKINVDNNNKSLLINFVQAIIVQEGITNYTSDDATIVVEKGLESGIFYEAGTKFTMVEVDALYNSVTGSNIEYTLEYAPNNTVSVTDTINIVFEDNSTTKSTGSAVRTSYRTHPAFTFGNEEVDGIWVGKFETSTDESTTCYSSNSTTNCTADKVIPRILPNVKSLRYQTVSTQFATSQLFSVSNNTYGLNSEETDSHMMKNSEWGAVAYLSHSVYGINGEIRINNNSNFITGCGADVDNDDSTSSCEIAYGGATSYPQSTTGNISGIFDMSGGAWEYVMGVLADDSGDPRSGYSDSYNSGFNGIVYNDGSESLYQLGVGFPDSKYYDLYETKTGNSIVACDGGICYGHALSETSEWYSDYASFVYPSDPWFRRGGYYGSGVNAGAFGFNGDDGGSNYDNSWRSVLVVG